MLDLDSLLGNDTIDNWDDIDLTELLTPQTSYPWQLAYTPDTSLTRKVMEKVKQQLSSGYTGKLLLQCLPIRIKLYRQYGSY